jgi:membrane fusion protein, multidrug efflux system
MNKFMMVIVVGASLMFASCGARSKDGNDLKSKQARLESLKKQQESTAKEVADLEKEISKLDTSAGKAENIKLVAVRTLANDTFTHFIDLQGKIESENVSNVTPRGGPGQVKAIYVKRGDAVRKGQALLKLDDAIARQQVAAANQGVNTAKTQVAFLQNIYERQQNLWNQKIGTEVQVITAKNNVENAQNQLKAAQEQLKLAHEQLNFTNVTADISGVVDDITVKVGESFSGVNQIRLVNSNNLKATTQVPENYLGRVSVGTPVKITVTDIGKTINAKVTATGKFIDPTSRSSFLEARIAPDKALHPNQIAQIRIQDYSAPNVITIPINTLQTDEKGKYVMVAVKENGKMVARKKIVVPGELYGDKVEVKSGLTAGDVLITDGFQGLYEGQGLTTDAK